MNVERAHTAPPPGFTPGLKLSDPLAAHWLGQAAMRLRREVAWLWHERGGETGSVPPMVEPLGEALDLLRWHDDRLAFFANDPTAAWLSEQIAQPAPVVARPERGGFSWLVQELSLSDVECFALALALGGAIDSARGAVIAACHNDPSATAPTLALVQRLWDDQGAVLDLLDPALPLVALGLLGIEPGQWEAPMQVPAVVARQLLSPAAPPPGALAEIAPGPLAGDEIDAGIYNEPVALAVARLAETSQTRATLLPLLAARGAPTGEIAARIAAGLARPLVQIGATEPEQIGPLLLVAYLRGAAVYLPGGLLAAPEGAARRWLARLPLVVLAGMTKGDKLSELPAQITLPRLELPDLPYSARLAQWRRELPAIWAGATGRETLTECARRFRYEAGGIARVARTIRAMEPPPDATRIFAACRADLDLGELAQPVRPRFTLDELMLPPKQAEQMAELITAHEALATVHHDWGTARAWNESGLSVLFAGPPGTGKTMAAEAVARAVGMPMYRIDLSQVVNKYIGETEKNLRLLFDAADAADVLLFFDEADALFGKRTEVKEAQDRYANLEVSYLLERMERFKGMAVLASNRKKDLDEAFMRRLRYVVQFPLPGAEERLRIWQAVLPEAVDCSALDIKFLADRIPLAGGHIRSAVFNACLQSVRAEGPPRLEMPAVVRALKDEFDKLGRAVSLDQFGPYAAHVRE